MSYLDTNYPDFILLNTSEIHACLGKGLGLVLSK